MADIHKLTDDLSVAPQLVASDIDDISQLKFRSILCNRPDQEEQGQPEYDDIRKLAEAAGIEVRFQPVNGAAISDVCLLYTSPSPRDRTRSRMPSSA